MAAVLTVIFATIAVLIILVIHMWSSPGSAVSTSSDRSDSDLTMPEDLLPDNVIPGKTFPVLTYKDSDGKEVSLTDYAKDGDNIWIMFFASWCPDCEKQLKNYQKMKETADNFGVRLIFIDRFEDGKETIEDAKNRLYACGAGDAVCLFDENAKGYQAAGMHEIPGSVVLSSDGTVLNVTTGVLTEGEMKDLLSAATVGKDAITLDFLERKMIYDGGMITGTITTGSSPTGDDVLSESEGLLLYYAEETDNKELFSSVWSYISKYMENEGLFSWIRYANGTNADTNALLDDLTIWYALHEAGSRWYNTEYTSTANVILEAILGRCTSDGMPVSSCSLNGNGAENSISMPYIVPVYLDEMVEEQPDKTDVFQQLKEILSRGKISDTFPLYYSSYSYSDESYADDDLNTAEALITLWHLAMADSIDDDSVEWLENQVREGTLYARYHTDGTVVTGYDYYNCAVYGLAALTLHEADQDDAAETALRRMERVRVSDADSEWYGAFGSAEGNYRSFDQLIAMIAELKVIKNSTDIEINK